MVLEKRTFVNEKQTEEILEYLTKNSIKKDIENQAIYTYHTGGDFRLIKTNKYVKLDLKKDNDEQTVFVSNEYQSNLETMFFKLGMDIEVKRYRTRHRFLINNFYVTLDENVKYGNVLRIKLEEETSKEELNKKITDFFKELGIEKISTERFQELYNKYRLEWSNLVKTFDEDEFLGGVQ